MFQDCLSKPTLVLRENEGRNETRVERKWFRRKKRNYEIHMSQNTWLKWDVNASNQHYIMYHRILIFSSLFSLPFQPIKGEGMFHYFRSHFSLSKQKKTIIFLWFSVYLSYLPLFCHLNKPKYQHVWIQIKILILMS